MLCVLFCVAYTNNAHGQNNDQPPLNYIYKPGDNNYACFRIPALINTAKNNLLAFAEARKNGCGDSGDIDLVLKRSEDGGKTWSNMQVVWNDSTNTCGNPVPIQDIATGKIWLVCSWNSGIEHEKKIRDKTSKYGRRVFTLSSDDEGKTWSAPKEITQQVKMPDWTWYATGPCHGVQISKGKYKNRLVVPINHIEAGSGKNFAHIIYSDDHGDTWKLGNNTPLDMANETTVAEIGKGQLILNSRSSDRKTKYRQVTTSADGGQTWTGMHIDSTLIEPICQGSLLNYKLSPKKSILLFCNPANQAARANLTVRISLNDGKTWSTGQVIFPGPSAYSDIAVNKDKQVVCLYEGGLTKPYEGIAVKAIDLNQLLKP
ncbi:MAG: Exo-alpha-sialidase [Mucilaginibacter sp.]|nr:Exo-alpha-sialidase [Mucilaginibacter sp.]